MIDIPVRDFGIDPAEFVTRVLLNVVVMVVLAHALLL